ncbi:MAG: SPOR domain-containing protein [Bacteroidetes bacterium]|nr:MAG: SPOR domain-containing protein [Bacteroidota bacterium]
MRSGRMARWTVVCVLWCAAAVQAQDTVFVQPRTERLSTFERSFRPSFYDTEVYLYKRTDSSKTFGRGIDRLTVAAPETLQGYRVQLVATNNYDEAVTVRNDLLARFPASWFYTVYEVPAYKIRVGDFVSRAEAKGTLEQFRGEGFKNAWIVPDRVIRNQPPKPPAPQPIDSTAAAVPMEP